MDCFTACIFNTKNRSMFVAKNNGTLPFCSLVMHQSFATTSPQGPGNSGDINFSLCKAQVKSLHCRDFVLVKSLLKVPAPGELLPCSWAFIMNPCHKPTTKSY